MNRRVVPVGQPQLSRRDFDALCAVFSQRVGLQFTEASLHTFERRLGERMVELGFHSFRQYCELLGSQQSTEPEMQLALEAVTTAETYFFRQEQQLRSFASEVIPRLRDELGASRRMVIWSAGCSTGEEVYTLAILLADSGAFEGWDVRIIGSDLCRRRVELARKGVYREASFRTTEPSLRQRYFEQCDEGWRVCPSIRSMCHFNQLNIIDDSVSMVGRANVVFCRNVLIYFGEEARGLVLNNLHRRLFPGGYLFLGHSESLVNQGTEFQLLHLEGDLAYRKAPLHPRSP